MAGLGAGRFRLNRPGLINFQTQNLHLIPAIHSMLAIALVDFHEAMELILDAAHAKVERLAAR